MSYLSHSGANVLGNESSWKRKFQGAKVPPMVLSLLGAKVRGNESSSYGEQRCPVMCRCEAGFHPGFVVQHTRAVPKRLLGG